MLSLTTGRPRLLSWYLGVLTVMLLFGDKYQLPVRYVFCNITLRHNNNNTINSMM